MSSILAGPAAARTPRRSSAAGGSLSDRRDRPPIPRTPAVRRGGPALRVTRRLLLLATHQLHDSIPDC